MLKYKVFISSVQSEFSQERQLVFDFIRNDELMGQYFEPFIFEQIAAQDANPRQLYLGDLYFYHFRATSPDHARSVEQNLKI